ncbi:tRNA methyltransferase 10 homolog B isoform X1 [Cygnus atratus]|uniref:tRNA methyltransferase 10 homolog B isoform X1 n=1 Tax=Cygnus atratus TaxID=8868 RepID=UPI0021B80A97|nr:tRNA methyltransferase 10 homolog B isoform X1 [Cygnus atratus]
MEGGSAAGGPAAGEAAALREALRLLRIEPSIVGSSTARAGGAAPCSRNVLRKRRRWERVLAARRRRRRQERERSRARRAGGRGAARRHSKALAEERLLEARASGPRLCVDLGMADRMTLKETSRLASQIRRLYGANRQAEKPFWLYLTEFVVGSLIYEECFRMNDGFSNYLMDTTQESYLDLFPLDAIVYLTPDSENVLEDIDPKKVYILGGLVDESIHKKLTLRRAQEQSLQTARLPIREYMVKAVNTKNYHSETLAINQDPKLARCLESWNFFWKRLCASRCREEELQSTLLNKSPSSQGKEQCCSNWATQDGKRFCNEQSS